VLVRIQVKQPTVIAPQLARGGRKLVEKGSEEVPKDHPQWLSAMARAITIGNSAFLAERKF
jgi:hypothetical protein